MEYLYVYARVSEGYECVSKDLLQDFSSEKRNGVSDFDRLESFRVYSPPSEQEDDLPDELYFYKERLASCGAAYVIGRTNFIRAGASKLSGERGTCMIQKYIYTEDDIDDINANIDTIFSQRTYYDKVDDYLNHNNPCQYGLEELGDWKLFVNESIIGETNFKKFIIACGDAFTSDGRKVYVVLPSNDKKGTQFALNLSRAVFSCLPLRILQGAGFVTYSPSFENISRNPIPNSVPLVFLQRSDETESPRNSGMQKGDTYFDFDRGVFLTGSVEQICVTGVEKLFCAMNTPNCWPVVNKFCNESFSEAAAVSSTVFFSWLLLILGKYEMQEAFCALHYLFLNSTVFTQCGIEKICQIFDTILTKYTNSDELLEICGEAYVSNDVFKERVLHYLCAKCNEYVQTGSDDELFRITDYEYVSSELNDDIVDEIYSNPDFFDVGTEVFWSTVDPVVSNKGFSELDKHEKILKFISGNFIGKYDRFIQTKILEDLSSRVIVELSEVFVCDGFEGVFSSASMYELLNSKYLSGSKPISPFLMNKEICATVAEILVQDSRVFSQEIYVRKISEWIERYNLDNDKRFKSFISKVKDRKLEKIFFEEDISSASRFLNKLDCQDQKWLDNHEDLIRRFLDTRIPVYEEECGSFLTVYAMIIELDLLRRQNEITQQICNSILRGTRYRYSDEIMSLHTMYEIIEFRRKVDYRMINPSIERCLREYVRNSTKSHYSIEQRDFLKRFGIDVSFEASYISNDRKGSKGSFFDASSVFLGKITGRRKNKDEREDF